MRNIERFVQRIQVMRPAKRLYHFTDSRNLPSIRKLGLLPTAELRARNVGAITGGDADSLGIDQYKGLDGYVRLSFCPSHPMSHVALERGSIEQIRVLSICASVLLREGVRIADQVATASEAEIGLADEMINRLDFEATYEYLDWRRPEEWARRHAAEKWEALIPGVIGVDLIRGF